jgi:hypothetical protein
MDTLLQNNPLSFLWLMAVLWLVVLGPFLALWIALSMRRDLHRIADFCEFRTKYPATSKGLEEMHDQSLYESREGRVSNSAFGR